ncbi:MAG: sigma-70 family RNA polymerase sigma factor [Verrucomicrobia bacterium]|nr:sigma-70 family RNA polymerase sigma factor [Verrucomicrobiota bacterium]
MNTATLISGTSDDTHLVELSLRGDTRAFGNLVERHQSLVCGLAYSACGNVHVSEDLAQETFITAWQQLRTLREKGNLRGWLCGIARHVINNFLRRQQRTPTALATDLDKVAHPASEEPPPDERAIQEQESAMLWRTLQTLPETYREPMVLFYRQNESVAAVAESLGVSEDAVKQRLARGRAMLAEQVERRLGNTLRQTMPTAAFTFGVLAALPLATTSASAATAGMTLAKGGASGKPLVMALLNGVLSPLLAFVAAGVGYKVSMDSARSVEEQRMIKKFFRVMLAAILFFSAYTVALVIYGRWLALQHPVAYVALLTGMIAGCVLLCAGGLAWALWQNRKVASAELAAKEEASLPVGKWGVPHLEYRSRLTFLGLPLVHMRLGRKRGEPIRPVKAWFAMGDFAVGVIGAFGACTIAPISLGACSLGLISLGGLAVGVACWGGLGIGVWAIGGCALGWQAYGGCVVAWEAAQGGLVAARHHALGNVAVAQHVNDAVARAAMRLSTFFQFARWAVKYAVFLNLVWFLPLALLVRKAREMRSSTRPA